MQQALGTIDQAIATPSARGDCNLELDFSKRHAPVYKVPQDKLRKVLATPSKADDEAYLRQLCEDGLVWRYGSKDVAPEISAAPHQRLDIIASKNFCSYFLIVWDFCNYARENGIPVGASGSGVGTMVGLPARALQRRSDQSTAAVRSVSWTPSRNEMPDIDIDICQDGRGRSSTTSATSTATSAQIITFGTLAAKGRVQGRRPA
jgi:DNA polymerase-3 subunit alpha